MSGRATAAAREINSEWLSCLERSHVLIADCPSDETVAEIIDRHCPETPTE